MSHALFRFVAAVSGHKKLLPYPITLPDQIFVDHRRGDVIARVLLVKIDGVIAIAFHQIIADDVFVPLQLIVVRDAVKLELLIMFNLARDKFAHEEVYGVVQTALYWRNWGSAVDFDVRFNAAAAVYRTTEVGLFHVGRRI